MPQKPPLPTPKTKKNKGFSFEKTVGGVSEYTLIKNGLRVLLREDRSTPVVGVMATYHVGSRNEGLGVTGATHLLEHMMFKGSTNHTRESGESIWSIDEKGGMVNATTWTDRTNYYCIVPPSMLSLAISVEADRMRNALLKAEDLVSERVVVLNEYEIRMSDPRGVLDEAVTASAYMAHPYRHPTIGWRSDIEGVSIEELKEFYDTFYHPNNATVTVVGNFDTDEVLAQIEATFGVHPRSPAPIPPMYTKEPPQRGERRVAMTQESPLSLFECVYKIPEATHSDIPALLVLAFILGGADSSRLHALVDDGMATATSATAYLFHDPGVLAVEVTLSPKVKPQKIEQLVKDMVRSIREDGVTREEFSRAKACLIARERWAYDGAYRLLDVINNGIAVGDWALTLTLKDRIATVTEKDVTRVARAYLTDNSLTIGYSYPL